MKAVFDSDVLIDFLQGNPNAKIELNRCSQPCYSIITWMEIMGGAKTPAQQTNAELLLSSMRLIELSHAIAARTVALRKSLRLKLPDAIILATADCEDCVLVTRNTKDFDRHNPRPAASASDIFSGAFLLMASLQ